MKKLEPAQRNHRAPAAYTLVEAFVAIFVLGIIVVSLFAAFSSGLAVVRLTRENLRATQIMMQKMETIRLLSWLQGTNATFAPQAFSDWYDPTGTNTHTAGALYQGVYSVGPAPKTIPTDYATNMRTVTITVYWTNYPHGPTAPIVRTRQMQTYVARYGMESYVY